MATSATFNFTLDISDIMEDAYERVGKEMLTGYDYKTARRSLDLLLLEWQNKGLNLWTIKNASQTLTSGTSAYTLSAEKLDIVEGLLRTDAGDVSRQSDLSMKRISVSNYARQTNKLTTGRPTQYWIQRAPGGITIHLWPVPDGSRAYVFNYYYIERIEDTGKPGSNTIDVPARYLPALTAGLAYYIGLKTPAVMAHIPVLKAVYDEQWDLASDAAREKASLFIKPGGYAHI